MNKFIKRIGSAIAIGCACVAVIGTVTFSSEVLGMTQSTKIRRSGLTHNEMLAIAEAGGHGGDNLGNILAFAFSNHKKTVPLVLCSQMLPPDSTRNVSDAISRSFQGNLPIANAVHWVAFLAMAKEASHEELHEQRGELRMKKLRTNQKKQKDGRQMLNEEVIKWLNGERQEDLNNFVREVSNFVEGDGWLQKRQKAIALKYYCGLKEYIGIFSKVATKSGVTRPGGDGGGCIVSKEGYEATIAFIENMIRCLREGQPISKAERLMSVGKKPNGHVDEAYRLVPDYIQHASHTEAQLYVLKQAFFEGYAIQDSFIASTKLPCWSCVMLPILEAKNMHAWEFGLTKEEVEAYPNMIVCPDGAQRPSKCSGKDQTKIRLSLQESTELRNYLEYEAAPRQVEKTKSSQMGLKRQKGGRNKSEKDSQQLLRFFNEEQYDVGAGQSEDEEY